MHKMNDASMSRKQAAAVVWASCLPGTLQRVLNTLSLHRGGLPMLERSLESVQCSRIGSEACSCIVEADTRMDCRQNRLS